MPDPEFVVRSLFTSKQLENALVRKLYRETLFTYSDIVRILTSWGITPLTKPAEWAKATEAWDDIFDAAAKRKATITADELARIGVFESERAARAIGVGLGVNRVSPELMHSILRSDPIQGLLLREWFVSESNVSKMAVRRSIQAGLSNNETVDQIATRLRGRHTGKFTSKRFKSGKVRREGIFRGGVMKNTSTRHVQAIVRTSINEITNRAHNEVYSRHPDVTTEWEWVSVLDGKTSDICISLSGQRFKYGEHAIPPGHINCRSQEIAVVPGATPSISASGGVQNPDWKRGDPPETKWLQKPGPTTASNYEDWLRGIDPKAQNEILGPGKAQLFRDGKLNLKQLVDRDGRSRTIAQLGGK